MPRWPSTSRTVLRSSGFNHAEIYYLKRGGEIYRELCFACHGVDGKGMPMAGTARTLAPPLRGAPDVLAGPALVPLVLLHGLSGPVGSTFVQAQMVSMSSESNLWISEIASYVRNSFGNHGAMVTEGEVKRLREQTQSRTPAFYSGGVAPVCAAPAWSTRALESGRQPEYGCGGAGAGWRSRDGLEIERPGRRRVVSGGTARADRHLRCAARKRQRSRAKRPVAFDGRPLPATGLTGMRRWQRAAAPSASRKWLSRLPPRVSSA